MPSSAPSSLKLSDAASIAAFKDGAVLLVLRGRAPYAGRWSLPGGKIETGESGAEAALRELADETGVRAEIVGMLDRIEIPVPEPEGAFHLLTVFYGRHVAGTPRPGDDSQEAQFVALGTVATLLMTEGTASLIQRAAERLLAC